MDLQLASAQVRLEDAEKLKAEYAVKAELQEIEFSKELDILRDEVGTNTESRSIMSQELQKVKTKNTRDTKEIGRLESLPDLTVSLKNSIREILADMTELEGSHREEINTLKAKVKELQDTLSELIEAAEGKRTTSHIRTTEAELSVLDGSYEDNTIYYIIEE